MPVQKFADHHRGESAYWADDTAWANSDVVAWGWDRDKASQDGVKDALWVLHSHSIVHLKLYIVDEGEGYSGSSSGHHRVHGYYLRHSLVVEFNDIVPSCTGHEQPAFPDEKPANEGDRWVALDMTLHQVMVIEENQLLCLFIIQRAKLTEVIPEDLNTVFEW